MAGSKFEPSQKAEQTWTASEDYVAVRVEGDDPEDAIDVFDEGPERYAVLERAKLPENLAQDAMGPLRPGPVL